MSIWSFEKNVLNFHVHQRFFVMTCFLCYDMAMRLYMFEILLPLRMTRLKIEMCVAINIHLR